MDEDDAVDDDCLDFAGTARLPLSVDSIPTPAGRRRHCRSERIWRECLAQLLELMQTGPTRFDSHKKAEARLDRIYSSADSWSIPQMA
eukprot:9528370-Karenia_brevis.AAC.1